MSLTQKAILDKEQSRKDSQKQSGKTSRQLRREAAKKRKCGLEPARAPDAPHSRSAAGDSVAPLAEEYPVIIPKHWTALRS